MMDDEWVLKICIVGSNTDLNYEFSALTAENRDRKENLFSFGIVINTKRFEIDKQRVKLIMIVMLGQYGSMSGGLRRSYFEGSIGCVILFDKGDRASFEEVKDWQKEYVNCVSDSPISIVGIKTHKYKEEITTEALFLQLVEPEEVTTEEGQTLANKLDTSYYETTLKDKDQVSTILKALAKKYLESLR